jgi:hypothetical protein
MADVLYVLITRNYNLVLGRYLSITGLTDASIMAASADALGKFFIRVLHHGSDPFMKSKRYDFCSSMVIRGSPSRRRRALQ